MSRELNHKLCIVSTVLMLVMISATASFADTIDYDYDDMGQLISVEYGDGTVVEYVYDNLGNRLQKATTLAGATYSISGQVLADSVGLEGVVVTLSGAYSAKRITDAIHPSWRRP